MPGTRLNESPLPKKDLKTNYAVILSKKDLDLATYLRILHLSRQESIALI